MYNRTYQGQNISNINGVQVQIQVIMKDSNKINSGVVTESTKFVFRSRSARIIWLVQISAEMFDFDQVLTTNDDDGYNDDVGDDNYNDGDDNTVRVYLLYSF
jgi:hypothetical protein